jgi:hypothetical protein
MGKARVVGAFCALLFLSSSLLAQTRLDYRQQKELKDATSYLDEVGGYIGGMEKALTGLKPGDPSVPIETVERLKTTRDKAAQRLGYANDRLKKLPAANADVTKQADRAAGFDKTLADLQGRIDAVAGGAEKAVQQGTGAAYQVDFDRLKEINQMFGDPQVLEQRPEFALEIVKQIPAVKKERARIADKYADLLKQDTPQSRDMKAALAYFDGQFGRFDQAATAYANEAPGKIDENLNEALKMAKQAAEQNKPLFFGPDGGVNQRLRWAESRQAVLAVVDPDAGKSAARKIADARSQAEKLRVSLNEQIVRNNPAPQTAYHSSDADALIAIIKEKWASAGLPNDVLRVGINATTWQRSTRWEWDGVDTWRKVDKSHLQGFVAMKTSDTVANVYYVNLVKDHQADDKVTAHFFNDPKDERGVQYQFLIAKLK